MPKQILFVCTGNAFRSVTADYCCNCFIKQSKLNLVASSAGTFEATQDYVDEAVLDELKKKGINISNHTPKKLDQEMMDSYDLTIAIAKSHQIFIKNTFNKNVPLFNEIAFNKSTSIKDIDDLTEDIDNNRHIVEEHLIKTVNYIFDSMPKLIENILNEK